MTLQSIILGALAAFPVAFGLFVAASVLYEARAAREIPAERRCACCRLKPMSLGYRPLCTDCAEGAIDEG